MSRIGAREPEPIELRASRSMADLLWLANTRHGPGGHWFARVTHDDGDHDHLAAPTDAIRYLVDHGVTVPDGQPSPAALADLVAIREMARGLLDPSAAWPGPVLARLEGARFRLDVAGALVAVDADPWSAFVADLLPVLVRLVTVRGRLAICGNPHCRLVFLDESRSGTRRWCDDGGCGNRDRVGRFRRTTAARGSARGREPGRRSRAAPTPFP